MCEAAAYLLKDDQEELILESVHLLEHGDDHVKMVNIKSLSLVEHKIILELL